MYVVGVHKDSEFDIP